MPYIQEEFFTIENYTSSKYTNSADCLNTVSEQGRNATPIDVFPAVRAVLGEIELDMASDLVINKEVKANRILTLEEDGFNSTIKAQSVWLNPPGTTVTGGTYAERLYWLEQMRLSPDQRGNRPEKVKVVSGSQWIRKLYDAYKAEDVKSAIVLIYRGGSIGSLSQEILSNPICITCSGASSPVINNSGRLSFEIIENDQRRSQPNNTQSSMFILFPKDDTMIESFKKHFSVFGVVKV